MSLTIEKKRVTVIAITAILSALLIGGVGTYLFLTKAFLSGERLNRWAWEASYRERGLSVPQYGPREGYWGFRIGPPIHDTLFGNRTPPTLIHDAIDIDRNGLQHAPNEAARRRILIVGGSVAWGAYASSIATTYFSLTRDLLRSHGAPFSIDVSADGGWTARHSLLAVTDYLSRHPRPDLIVELGGLNDLFLAEPKVAQPHNETLAREHYLKRAEGYLANLTRLIRLTRKGKTRLLISLQPCLLEKSRLSALERRLVSVSVTPAARVGIQFAYQRLRDSLAELGREPGVFTLDASRLFGDESATTFADMWHFADPGHVLLAKKLSGAIEAMGWDQKRSEGVAG